MNATLAIAPVQGMPLLLQRQADRDRDSQSERILRRADETVERVDKVLDRLEARFGRVDDFYRERLRDRRESQT